MSEPIVGSIGVAVVPNAEGFKEKLERDLVPGSSEIGDQIGRAIGSSMSDAVSHSIDDIRAKLDALGLKDISIRLSVNDDGSLALAEGKITAVDSAAGNSGGGFSIMGGKIIAIGLAAVAAADIAIPALLAIGAAAAGGIAAIGIGALGFSGIGAALQAKGSPLSGGGGGSGGGANSQLALQSAQINATQATQTAQDQLTSALQTQQKAELSLHDARVQALQDLEDLDNKLKDNNLSQQQAAIALDTAKQTLALTLAAPGAGLAQYADQVKTAQLNVAVAQQKYNELTLTGTRLQQQDTTAHKQGVDQNPSVVAAKQALVDANHKLVESQQNVATTAEKNSIALQQAGNSAAGAAGGLDAYQQALAKLNPLQQQFVQFLVALKPQFDELKAAASEFLPGLEAGISKALPAFGPILGVVSSVAKALGSALDQVFSQFNSPAGKQFTAFLTVELPKQIQFLTTLFIEIGQIVANVFQAAGPLIDAADKAIVGFFQNINASAAGNGLKSFFDSLIPLMPKFFSALTAVSGLIGQVLKAIAPAIGPILDLIKALATELGALAGPVITPLAQALGDLINAFLPLEPIAQAFFLQILPPLTQALQTIVEKGVVPFVAALVKDLQPLLPVIGAAITALVQALAPFIVQLIQALLPILPQVVNDFIEILKALTPLLAPLGQLLDALTPLIAPLTTIGLQFLTLTAKLLPVVVPLLKGIIDVATPFLKALTPLLDFFSNMTNAIDDAIGKLAEFKGLFSSAPLVSQQTLLNELLQKNGINTNTAVGNTSLNAGAARATGGPVLAGHMYHVGEFGPESFIPQVSGQILNASDTARLKSYSNQTRNNYFNLYGVSDPIANAHAMANRMAARNV